MTNISSEDKTFLKLAIESATSAYHLGNYPVGAVLTIDNKVIGVGENKINENKSFFEHAEIKLISRYSTQLYKAYREKLEINLYSTLEPCIQCLGASVTNHIDKIFYITKDPNGGACNIKHDNIGDWYKHWWPRIIY
nr:nucleoside deaminase [Candidatus Dojkabacteria bacterium]